MSISFAKGKKVLAKSLASLLREMKTGWDLLVPGPFSGHGHISVHVLTMQKIPLLAPIDT